MTLSEQGNHYNLKSNFLNQKQYVRQICLPSFCRIDQK